jgi:hypothetical protein
MNEWAAAPVREFFAREYPELSQNFVAKSANSKRDFKGVNVFQDPDEPLTPVNDADFGTYPPEPGDEDEY